MTNTYILEHSLKMINSSIDNQYMQLALQKAEEAYGNGEVPVGAVIVNQEGSVIASAANSTISTNDPTAHAEMIVIRTASMKLNTNRLDFCDLYVTLEPCPMCAHAISLSRIRRLYFGAYDKRSKHINNTEKGNIFYKPEIIAGLNEQKCSKLIKNFFEKLR